MLLGKVMQEYLSTLKTKTSEQKHEFGKVKNNLIWLAIFLKSKWSKEQVELNIGGSSIVNALKQKALNEMGIPLPS